MDRPRVILNAAMTLDGKIASKSGDSQISCEEDLIRIHSLRAEVDGVMVGIGTVLADDPLLTVRRTEGKNPTRIIVDSRARTPIDANVMNKDAPTLIGVSKRAEDQKKKELQSAGAQILTGGEERVHLPHLLRKAYSQNIRRILLEGGSSLNWSMLSQGLVDQVMVAVAPQIVGGKEAKTLVGGSGFRKILDGVRLDLTEYRVVGDDVLLTYNVEGSRSDPES